MERCRAGGQRWMESCGPPKGRGLEFILAAYEVIGGGGL